MMRLSELLAALPPALAVRSLQEAGDPVIRGIQYDSRSVSAGDLFVALRGELHDGHDYLESAVAAGAVAVVVESDEGLAARLGDVAIAAVPDSRRALAWLATRFYGEPAEHCALIGVTGTNGKTSTTYLVESILARAGQRVGLIGTVEVRYAGERESAVNTTPESLDLQRLLRAMLTNNVDSVVMEVSSHGLEMGRVRGCRFRVAAFTNLTQDHLDFHGSMDAYRASKERLFREHLAPGAVAVVNVDDPAGEKVVAAARESGARILRCTRRGREAEVMLLDADVHIDGTRARLALPSGELEVEVPLIGDFNLENLVVACGIASALEVEPARIAEGIARCPQVPGRLERVGAELPARPTVLVDYAHTPDAVDKLLAAVRPLARGRLVVVFGCGGDRDRRKRPLMAEAVARHADRAIATSDNPRTEDPEAILRDVEAGLGAMTRVEPTELDGRERGYSVIVDRRAAIQAAIALAGSTDTVVLAGKGHEDYQIVGREKLPFDDRREALRALRAEERR